MHCWAACCQSKILQITNMRLEGAEAPLTALLWPLPAPSHFLFLRLLSQDKAVFKRWLREEPQSRIKLMFKTILNSQITKRHLKWFISCFRKQLKPKEVSRLTSGLAQGWPWVASHLAFLSICFLKCMVPPNLLESETPSRFSFIAEFPLVPPQANK